MELNKLFFDISIGKYNVLLYIVIIGLVVYFYIKFPCDKSNNLNENMTNVTDTQLADAVKKYYLSDEFVKNISVVAAQIQQSELNILGDLNVKGKFTSTSNNILAPGLVIAYVSPKIPNGWLLCDGKEYPIISYQNLYNVIERTFGETGNKNTFRVPNYNGAFLRGTGTLGPYSGPPLNKSQNHATQVHNHTISDNQIKYQTGIRLPPFTLPTPLIGKNNSIKGDHVEYNLDPSTNVNSQNDDTIKSNIQINNTTVNVDPNETRPYNFGVNWIIKI
jgi:microcystin-dependent protein